MFRKESRNFGSAHPEVKYKKNVAKKDITAVLMIEKVLTT